MILEALSFCGDWNCFVQCSVTKYVMNRCFPSKTELISNVIEELLEHHREYHEMKFQKDTSVENRKLAFTLFTYLSVGLELAWNVGVLSLCARCLLAS